MRYLVPCTLFALVLGSLAVCLPLVASTTVAEPNEYRVEEYDAPVPATISGGTRVDAAAVKKLRDQQQALIIDVIPEHRRPDVLPEGQLWFPVDHQGIPGSVWLPDTGYGVLSNTTINYLKSNLEKYSNGNLDKPIVFYCRLDCWMSWNAAKRSLEFGYTNVYWFADGTDGWTFEGWELTTLTPEPGERQ